VNRVQIWFVGILFVVVGDLGFLYAQQIDFPRSLQELGGGYTQVAYGVSAKVVLIDYQALRRDFKELRRLSDSHIRRLVEIWGGIVTSRQLSLRNFLTTDYKTQSGPLLIIQPAGYHRAGVVPVVLGGEEIGLLDLKGIGLAPRGSYHAREELTYVKSLLAFLDGTFEPNAETEQVIEKLVLDMAEQIGSTLADIKGAEQTAKPEMYRHLLLNFRTLQQKIAALEVIRKFVKNPSPKNREAALEAIRSFDYTNGGISLDRAVREMTVQKISQKLFDEYNHRFGTSFGTVDTYFVLELPFSLWTPGGQLKKAAVVGRQASWRMDHHLAGPTLPPGLLSSGLGGLQTTGLGDLVDFELVESMDSRVKHLLTWSNEPLAQPIDAKVQQAYEAHKNGDSRALKRFYQNSLKLVRPGIIERWITPRKPKAESSQFFVPNTLQAEATDFIRQDLSQADPDMFKYFDILRRLAKTPNARVLTALFLEKGAKHWPKPVAEFAAEWIPAPEFDFENPSVFMGLIHEFRKVKRPDLVLTVIAGLRNRYVRHVITPFFNATLGMTPKDRIDLQVFADAVAQIPKTRSIDTPAQLEWIAYMILEAINEPDETKKTKALTLAYEILEGVHHKNWDPHDPSSAKLSDEELATFEFPITESIQHGFWSRASLELLYHMSPPMRTRIMNTCAEAIQRLPVP